MQEQPLENALREAAEWKSKALAAQASAEAVQQRAQTLKDAANQAVHSAKDLSASLHRARAEILALQSQQKALAKHGSQLEEALAEAKRERTAAQSALSTVQQQLALYMAALNESRQGGDLEQIQSALRAVLDNPTAEEALQQQLQQAQEENDGLRQVFERAQSDLSYLENEVRTKDELLEDKERDYLAIYGELDLMKSLVQEMRGSADSSERLHQKHQRTLELLRQRDAAVRTLEFELQSLLQDNRRLEEVPLSERLEKLPPSEVVTLESAQSSLEIEALRANIVDLEDQISDLEIVNSDLYQRIAELESAAE